MSFADGDYWVSARVPLGLNGPLRPAAHSIPDLWFCSQGNQRAASQVQESAVIRDRLTPK